MDSMKDFLYSITFFLNKKEGKDDFSVPQTKLSKWLNLYTGWLAKKNGDKAKEWTCIVDLYMLELFSVFDKSVKLLETIVSCKSSASIHINFRDLIVHEKEMNVLKEKNLIRTINVYLSQEDVPYRKFFESTIKALIKKNYEVRFFVNKEILEEYNFFASEILNEKGVCVFPQQTYKPVKTAPKYPICFCKKRLQLCVDEKGFVYPCQGLASIGKCAIGDVSDKTFDHYLTYKCGCDDLQILLEKGPTLKKVGKTVENLHPWICRRHLYEVMRAEEINGKS